MSRLNYGNMDDLCVGTDYREKVGEFVVGTEVLEDPTSN